MSPCYLSWVFTPDFGPLLLRSQDALVNALKALQKQQWYIFTNALSNIGKAIEALEIKMSKSKNFYYHIMMKTLQAAVPPPS